MALLILKVIPRKLLFLLVLLLLLSNGSAQARDAASFWRDFEIRIEETRKCLRDTLNHYISTNANRRDTDKFHFDSKVDIYVELIIENKTPYDLGSFILNRFMLENVAMSDLDFVKGDLKFVEYMEMDSLVAEVGPETNWAIYHGTVHLVLSNHKYIDVYLSYIKLNLIRNYGAGHAIRDTVEFDLTERFSEPVLLPDNHQDLFKRHPDKLIAETFFAQEDSFMNLKKRQFNDNLFPDSILESWTANPDSVFASFLDSTGVERPYYTYHCINRVQALYNNYLSQKDVVLWRNSSDTLTALTLDTFKNSEIEQVAPDMTGYKFSLFEKRGSEKRANIPYVYIDRECSDGQMRIDFLARELRDHFERVKGQTSRYELSPKTVLSKFYHHLAVKNGRIRNLSLFPKGAFDQTQSRLRAFFDESRLDDDAIIFDITEFFSNYATTIMIKDESALHRIWNEDVGVRIHRTSCDQPKIVAGPRIVRDLIEKLIDYDVWVLYQELDKPDIQFYVYNDELVYSREYDYDEVYDKLDFIFVTKLNQLWLNFDKSVSKLHYIDNADVTFTINVFNIQRAEELIENGEYKFQGLDLFGLRSYLRFLFGKAENEVVRKDQEYLLGKYPVLDTLLQVRFPEFEWSNRSAVKAQLDLIYTVFKRNRTQLGEFFRSDEYRTLHVELIPYHKVFMQILRSYTHQNKQFLAPNKQLD